MYTVYSHILRGIIKLTQLILNKGYLDQGSTEHFSRIRLGMHGKVEKTGVDEMSISPDNP